MICWIINYFKKILIKVFFVIDQILLIIFGKIGSSPPPKTFLCDEIICSTKDVPERGIPKIKIILLSLSLFEVIYSFP